MGTNGSFFQNGLPVSSANSGVGNIPAGAPVPNKASSSFYLSGSVYATLMNSDALLAAINAQQALATAAATAAQGSATSAATSAAAAASSLATLTAAALLKANNLADLTNVAQAKINLSLVKGDVGLGNVDNTSDANKPVSTAQATADALVASNAAAATALKANIASPTFTGVPLAPTAGALTNNTQVATTQYADSAVSTLSGTVTTALGLKAPLASPALTGTPTAPTAAALDNSTKVATTAYADAAVGVEKSRAQTAEALLAPLASPALTGTPTVPTATVGTNTTQAASTAFVLANSAGGTPASATPIMDGTGAVGVGTKYAREDHVHPSDTSRATMDAYAYHNILLNGGMEIDQANLGGATSAGGYAVDGWVGGKSGTMVVSVQQVSDAPAGFANSLKVTVTTAEASMAAGDFMYIRQPLEGTRTAKLNFGTASAQSVSLGFWVKIHRTGTYSGSIRNAAINRSYPFTFTQNVADTWEYKTVTIAGDTTGTWIGNTTAAACDVVFTVASGTTFLGTAGSWAASNLLGATGTTNGVAATTDVFQITGVSMLPGTLPIPQALSSLARRSYADELRLCQRYWQNAPRLYSDFTATAAGNVITLGMTFATEMRVSPTVASASTGNSNATFISAGPYGTKGWFIQLSSIAAGRFYDYRDATADARL